MSEKSDPKRWLLGRGYFFIPVALLLLSFSVVDQLKAEIRSNQPAVLLYSDDFDYGNDDGWSTVRGEPGLWQAVDSVYTGYLEGDQKSSLRILDMGPWKSIRLEFDIMSIAGTDKAVYLGYKDSENNCTINIRTGDGGGDDIVFFLIEQRQVLQHSFYSYPTENGTWYHVAFEYNQGHFSCEVDSSIVFDLDVEASNLEWGRAGFELYTAGNGVSSFSVDNVRIICVDGNECEFTVCDANADGVWSISDAVYVVSYIFGGGQPPVPVEAGDANCDGDVSISDAVYVINYIFGGGPALCSS